MFKPLSVLIPVSIGFLATLRLMPLTAAIGLPWSWGWSLLIPAAILIPINSLVAYRLLKWAMRLLDGAKQRLSTVPTEDLVTGGIGIAAGFCLGLLLAIPFLLLGTGGVGKLALIAPFVMADIGYSTLIRRRNEPLGNLRSVRNLRSRDGDGRIGNEARKVLDTSVIIDGRIYDIARTGFLEGPLLVPFFIIEELQHIADSSDVLRRNRGRRGLDVLNRMSKDEGICIIIWEGVEEDSSLEVDARLVKLSKALGATVITNDFNLNKVAELHGVGVLNINELANALKPVVLPGEEMSVRVIRDGKEMGQGVGYLDDGTMIVVDGGRRFIGEQIGVQVTSVLQTSAGRMIFARLKPVEKAL